MTKQNEVFKVNKTDEQLERDVMELRSQLLEFVADSGHNVGVASEALIFALIGICEATCNSSFDETVSARLRVVADLLDAANSQVQ